VISVDLAGEHGLSLFKLVGTGGLLSCRSSSSGEDARGTYQVLRASIFRASLPVHFHRVFTTTSIAVWLLWLNRSFIVLVALGGWDGR